MDYIFITYSIYVAMPAEFLEDSIKIKTNNKSFGLGMLFIGPFVAVVFIMVGQGMTLSLIVGGAISLVGVIYLFLPEKFIVLKPTEIIITTTNGEVKDRYDPTKLVGFNRMNVVQNKTITGYSFILKFQDQELKLKGGYFGGVDLANQVEGLLRDYVQKHYGLMS